MYAPDYVINAGGVINVSCELRPGGYDPELAEQRVHEIPRTLARVFARAREQGMTTHAAAQELAEAALAASQSVIRISKPKGRIGQRMTAATAVSTFAVVPRVSK